MRSGVRSALRAAEGLRRMRRADIVRRVLASRLYKRKVARAKAKYSLRSIFGRWRALTKSNRRFKRNAFGKMRAVAMGRRNFRSAVVHQFYRKR